jgi:arginyl-tRNA synthetase
VEGNKELEAEGRGWFLKLEQGEKETVAIWKLCVERSLFTFDKIYKELCVEFDTLNGESMFGPYMAEVVQHLEKAKLLSDSEGAKVVFFENNKYPPLIVQKSDGASIYATRDLATDLWRKKKYGDNLLVINEVGSEQTLYFRQLYETEKMLGWFKEGERVHVAHGLYRLKEGKMSTREGNVIWLKDIIDEAKIRAAKNNADPEISNDVAIGALKFNDLKRDPAQDIVFDYDEMMNMQGDSGPYLQYACVRAKSALAKAASQKVKPELLTKGTVTPEAADLEKMLVRFPEIIIRAAEQYKPNILSSYLINLASQFNHFYAHNTIAQKENPQAPHNAALTEAFAIVVENGLRLLGINVPKRM